MLARTKVLWIVLCAVTLVAGLGLTTAQADVQTWTAADGWHTDTNTSANLWQYLRCDVDGVNDNYSTLDNFYAAGAVVGYDGWWDGAPALPVIGLENGQVQTHPTAPTTELRVSPVLAWKSPITGAVNVSFLLTDLDANVGLGNDGFSYHLFKSGVSTALSSGLVDNDGNSGTITVDNIAVSNDDMLYLQIGCGTGMGETSWAGDLTEAVFEITSVPEPTAITLLMTGLIGLLCYAWRKRK